MSLPSRHDFPERSEVEDLPDELEADFVPLSDGEPQDHRDIDPFQYDSLQAQEAFDAAVALAAEGDEHGAIQHFIRTAKIAEMAREWHLAAVACQRVGDFLAGPKPPYDLERAFRMYRRAIAAYENSGLFVEARELGYRIMHMRMLRARDLGLSWTQQLELRLAWVVAGFGYRPFHVVLTALTTILAFALVYWVTNGVVTLTGNEPIDFWHALYFSGIVFTTVGFGDSIPAPHMRMTALAEGFLGAFTIGLFVVVLANRLSRP